MYQLSSIATITGGRLIAGAGTEPVEQLVYDSRRVLQPAASVFFALRTGHNDGHRYLKEAWKKGVRNFVVADAGSVEGLEGASVLLVHDTLEALQGLAAHHRQQFQIPVIGITGSNGKTVVKEWLFQMLEHDHRIVRSPRSWNSQIGVPLSVWQMNESHSLAIFEAGISQAGEMERLSAIIQPTIGIFTNIGEAHSEGFPSKEAKAEEKLRLFEKAETLIYPDDDPLLHRLMRGLARAGVSLFGWGQDRCPLQLLSRKEEQGKTMVLANWNEAELLFSIPFVDEASIENALHCCMVLLILGYDAARINERLARLHVIDMRLQLLPSTNGCMIINDSYSADLTSLKIALDLQRQQGGKGGYSSTVILSEFFESGRNDEGLYREVGGLLQDYGVRKAILIGERIGDALRESLPGIVLQTYLSTEDFIASFHPTHYHQEMILVKGARRFAFERIVRLFEEKVHETVLEINLNALAHNLKEYRKVLQPGTKVMAMVKAFSYGSGGAEIASVLHYHHIDYLGVAYADEGADLVRAGVQSPIMVMNAEPSSFGVIVEYGLQPVLYSFGLFELFEAYLRDQGLRQYPVHIEVETGMNRLGFAPSELGLLCERLNVSEAFRVQSVFSHLAASEEAAQDDFTAEQARVFGQATGLLAGELHYPFLKHLSNSAAIIRHPQLQFDMVRLGIGLYGIEIDNQGLLDLQPVATLRSTIAQLKRLPAGGTVSYNRRGVVQRDSLIATVRIGYADGYSRQLGHGKGEMLIRGYRAPTIGTVCMDMTMFDVTDVPNVREGEDVILFGAHLPVQDLAARIGTIPYEIMTGISQRVKRVYYQE